MLSRCPACQADTKTGLVFNRDGFYFRTADSRYVQRYRCRKCKGRSSDASGTRWFRAKKRRFHEVLRKRFAKLGSIRGEAEVLGLNRKTTARKLVILGEIARESFERENRKKEPSRLIEFDDLETFEHTKCKPLSVTIAVQAHTRRILGIEVSQMPAKGMLVEKAKKYGPREDHRSVGRDRLFTSIKDLVHPEAVIKSDANPHYPADVKRHFPLASHVTYQSRRGTSIGGGELKKGGFDPIFSLNHTCASTRMNITRLLRKTWYTTKRADRLTAHLYVYADYHNRRLDKKLSL
jgi:transposase-like protein